MIILESATLFHTGGARLILCGSNWEKLETQAERLMSESDPTLVSAVTEHWLKHLEMYLLRFWL